MLKSLEVLTYLRNRDTDAFDAGAEYCDQLARGIVRQTGYLKIHTEDNGKVFCGHFIEGNEEGCKEGTLMELLTHIADVHLT